ncbi:MAG: MFS transporter [Candidatus Omnitrophica bacterium]|nr:MFS transporter [Candidatus Omnitrophota bacterium]
MAKHVHKVAFLAAIVYFIQGSLGISGIALPLFLRKLEWSISDITMISSLAALPWVFKITYGLFSDCIPLFGYRRKSYLILCSFIAATGWLSLVLLPSEKSWIMISLLGINFGFAATDVITDGLIVEHSTQTTSSIYQSIAWGSRSLGSIISGFIGGWLAAHWDPKHVFLLTMTLPLFVLGGAFFIHEKRMERSPFQSVWTPFERCFKLILSHNIRWFLAILICASIASSFGIPFFFFMKETLNFNETFLGTLSSLGWFGALVGSLIYFRWLRHISPKITLRWAILLNSINIFSTLLIRDTTSAFLLIFIGGVMGCLTLLPIMSSSAILTHHTQVEGSLFAVLMSVFNLGQILFGFLGGKIYVLIGLHTLIICTGVLGILGFIFVERLRFETPPSVAPSPP